MSSKDGLHQSRLALRYKLHGLAPFIGLKATMHVDKQTHSLALNWLDLSRYKQGVVHFHLQYNTPTVCSVVPFFFPGDQAFIPTDHWT